MASKFAVALVLAALVIYGSIEALPLLLGPSLTIESPQEGETVQGGVVRIQGTVARTTALTVNGNPLLPDESGGFSSTLAMAPGTSILTFAVKDRFGRTVTTTRTIYVPE